MKKLFCTTIILITVSVVCNCVGFTSKQSRKIYTIDKPLHFNYRGQHFVLGMSKNDVLKIQKEKLYYMPIQDEKYGQISYIILHSNNRQVDQIQFEFDKNDILYSISLYKKGTVDTYHGYQNWLSMIYGLYHENIVRNIAGTEISETNWYFNNKKYYLTVTFNPDYNSVVTNYTDFEKSVKALKEIR